MKKATLTISIILLTIILSLFAFAQVNAQTQNANPPDTADYPYWIEMMQDRDVNYYATVSAFEKYFKNRPTGKGSGWKQFKRWEYNMSLRLQPDGKLPDPGYVLEEYNKYYATRGGRSIGGNWTEFGPVFMPANGTGQPNGMGRINAFAFHPTDANIIWAGAPAGGLWKTTDHGSTWTSNTDQMPSLGVSAIVVNQSDPDTMYIGTGDRDANHAPGYHGVYKSTDGGTNWVASNNGMGNKVVGKMIMHPSNSLILLAATNGGIYKTTDAGASWTLNSSNSSHYKDIVFKPGDPTIVYATEGGRFYRSTNTGDTWTQITSGIGSGSRIVIGVSPANSAYVYVLQTGSSGFVGIYRSTDSGLTFSTRATTPNIMGYDCTGGTGNQSFYDLAIVVHPTNADILYTGGINIWKSTDGGSTLSINSHWTGSCGVSAVHADIHDLVFNHLNNRLYSGGDGGVHWTNDGGTTWPEISSGLGIAQTYKIGQSALSNDLIINGFQDNGTAIYYGGGTWSTEIGGDGMECIIDYTDNNYMYGETYNGNIQRSSNNGTNFSAIAGNGVNGITESGAWVTPYTLHESNPNTMYIGYKNVWRNNAVRSGSMPNWTNISSGAGFGSSNITVVEHSPADNDLLYIVYNSLIYRSENVNDASPTWTACAALTSTEADVEAHPTNANIVYAITNGDVYRSADKGDTWTSIKGTLPTLPYFSIVCDKRTNLESLYLSTVTGVYYRDNVIGDWVSFSNGLPANVDYRELDIYYGSPSILSVCTFGRGLWQSDLYSDPSRPPIAYFNADVTEVTNCPGTPVTVEFCDQSWNEPTSWSWTFTPSTVTYVDATSATSQLPHVQFNAPGTYTVQLIATNASGSNTLMRSNYLTVTLGESLPYTDDFESFPNGWTTSSSASYDWLIRSGSTPTSGTGPDDDHTLGSGSFYIYAESSSPAATGDEAYLESTCVNISGGAPYLKFWYHMYGAGMGSLTVEANTGAGWNQLWTIAGQQQTASSDPYLEASIDISAYLGSVANFRFKAIRGSDWLGDIAIDDVSITDLAPAADFAADNTLPANNTVLVNFTDQSTKTPTSWLWAITPATHTYQGGTSSTSQNPVVSFDMPGAYTIALTATNALGSGTETKLDYIHQGTPGIWTGTTSTDWNTTTNWENHMVPVSANDVSIPTAATNWPTYTGDFAFDTQCKDISMAGASEFTVSGNLTIASGRTLTVDANATIFVGGDWTNNGTFTPSNGTVNFYGTNPSTINIPSASTVYLIDDDISTWPGNWNGDIGTWIGGAGSGMFEQQTSTNAGGSSPEAGFEYINLDPGTRRLYYNAVNTSGLTSLTLDFQHMLDDYDGSAGYTLKVQYSTDGTNWLDSDWSMTPIGNIAASQGSATLTSASHGVGATNYYISFTITGNLYNINYWYIDDVKLSHTVLPVETFYKLTIGKNNAVVTTNGNIDIDNKLIIQSGTFTIATGDIVNVE